MEDAIESLSVGFKGKLDGLPVAMATMIENAVAKALAQHTASGEKAWKRPRKTSHQEALDVEEQALAASTNSAKHSQSDVSEVPQIVQSCVVPQNHRRGSDYKGAEFTIFMLTREPERQQITPPVSMSGSGESRLQRVSRCGRLDRKGPPSPAATL